MKFKILLAIALIAAPAAANAHGTTASKTVEAIHVATEKLEAEDAQALRDFAGVKGWPSGENLFVKIYLTQKREVLYVCQHAHVNSEMVINCARSR